MIGPRYSAYEDLAGSRQVWIVHDRYGRCTVAVYRNEWEAVERLSLLNAAPCALTEWLAMAYDWTRHGRESFADWVTRAGLPGRMLAHEAVVTETVGRS